jgi:hypothetical protein
MLTYHYTNVEHGLTLRRYWTNRCRGCAIKHRCTTAVERRITRWEHEHVLGVVQRRLDANPQAMRERRDNARNLAATITFSMWWIAYFPACFVAFALSKYRRS